MTITIYPQFTFIIGAIGVVTVFGGAESRNWLGLVFGFAVFALAILYHQGVVHRAIYISGSIFRTRR